MPKITRSRTHAPPRKKAKRHGNMATKAEARIKGRVYRTSYTQSLITRDRLLDLTGQIGKAKGGTGLASKRIGQAVWLMHQIVCGSTIVGEDASKKKVNPGLGELVMMLDEIKRDVVARQGKTPGIASMIELRDDINKLAASLGFLIASQPDWTPEIELGKS